MQIYNMMSLMILLIVAIVDGDHLLSQQLPYTLELFHTSSTTPSEESSTHTIIHECVEERTKPYSNLQQKQIQFPFTGCANNFLSKSLRPSNDTCERAISIGLNFTCSSDSKTRSHLKIVTGKFDTTLTCRNGVITITASVLERGKDLCRIKEEIQVSEGAIFHLFYKMPGANGAVFLTLDSNVGRKTGNCSYTSEETIEGRTIEFIYMTAQRHHQSRNFVGKILTTDILDLTRHEMLDNRIEQEFQYVQLLHKGAPYPECLCPQGTTPDCSDPAQRMTGTDKDTYYLPISGLHDGILDPENYTHRYGYWAAPHGNMTLGMSLKVPALIIGMELYLTNQSFTVYKREQAANNTILQTYYFANKFGLADVKYTTRGSYFFEWKFSSWNQSSVITDKILINFPGDRRVNYTSYPRQFSKYNMLYEILVLGRPLVPSDPTRCECFPGNGQEPEGCDDCRQCRCRNGMESDRICSPYLAEVTPNYGSLLGGTLLTIHGGLLKPHLDIDISARVTMGGNMTCIVDGNHVEDDRVVCRTTAGSVANRTLPLKVELLLAGFPHTILSKPQLNFTYRPDPSIERIITPQPVCRNRQISLEFAGSDLDVPDVIFLSSKDLGILANCTGADDGWTGVCQVPKINYHGGDIVNLNFKLNEQTLQSFNLSLHPEPSLNSGARITEDWRVNIGGSNLNVCHASTDYRISLGKAPCSITHLNKTQIRCAITKSDVMENKGRNVWVSVDGRHEEITIHQVILASSGSRRPLVVALIIFVLFIAATGAALTWKYHHLKNRYKSYTPTPSTYGESIELRDIETTPIYPHVDNLSKVHAKVVKERKVEFDNLEMHRIIGIGKYGPVVHATLKENGEQRTAILKSFKDANKACPEDLGEFLHETVILKSLNHPNILTFTGILVETTHLYIAFPYMANGNLRNYLSRQTFDLKRYLRMAIDVAQGMKYLSSKRIIHRNLAARTCMVSDEGRVLISEFQLAKDIFLMEYYSEEDPTKSFLFKWMAPESISDQLFSIKSDVWAYGVTLWEMFSGGGRPYELVESFNLPTILHQGQRLEKPEDCPKALYEIMLNCWSMEDEARPTFQKVCLDLVKLAKQENVLSASLGNFLTEEMRDNQLDSIQEEEDGTAAGLS